jgi:hypothetical protein
MNNCPARRCEKTFTAEDAKDAEVHRGNEDDEKTGLNFLRVLCVLRGEEARHFFTLS